MKSMDPNPPALPVCLGGGGGGGGVALPSSAHLFSSLAGGHHCLMLRNTCSRLSVVLHSQIISVGSRTFQFHYAGSSRTMTECNAASFPYAAMQRNFLEGMRVAGGYKEMQGCIVLCALPAIRIRTNIFLFLEKGTEPQRQFCSVHISPWPA